MNRREFLGGAAGAATLGLLARGSAARAAAASSVPLPVLMKAGHQHDHSASTLKLLAALGVEHICSGLPSRRLDEAWSVAGLIRLRQHVESFGLHLDAVPLPMSSLPIKRAELPEILLAKDPARDQAIGAVCQMIRNAGRAGIPMVQYNMTLLGVVRTGRVPGRGGASYSTFDYAQAQTTGLTEAGVVTAPIYWDRIEYFLKRVVPVAEEAKVKIALHPNDPGLPADRPFEGVQVVLSTVEGLKRFVTPYPARTTGSTSARARSLKCCRGPARRFTTSSGTSEPARKYSTSIFGTSQADFSDSRRHSRTTGTSTCRARSRHTVRSASTAW